MGNPPPRPDTIGPCTAISAICPVEATLYGYYPNLGANAFFAAFFGVAFLINLFLGIRHKTWTYMTAVCLGCIAECIGYIGRILMHNNPWDDNAFIIQIVLLIFAPAFLAAGIYLTLKHVVIQFGASWSRVAPRWYTYIFIGCDITSLVMQSAGGAMASIADPGEKIGDIGTDLMIAGIIFQVVVLAIFGLLCAEYSYRTYVRRDQLSHSALKLWNSTRFKLYIGAVAAAYLFIVIRCIYRIPELLGGWGGDLMRIESEFIVLEGVMIVLAVLAQTAFHPGIFFPAMATQAKKGRKMDLDDAEMEPIGSLESARPLK